MPTFGEAEHVIRASRSASDSIQIVSAKEIFSASTPYDQAASRCCIYALLKMGVVVYVGQSSNLLSRLAQHAKTKDFDSFWSTDAPREEMSAIEARYIVALNPRLNTSLPPQGEFMTERAAKDALGGWGLRRAIKSGAVTSIGLHLGNVFRVSEINAFRMGSGA